MKKRVISAIVLVAIFVPLLILGGIPFMIFMSVLGVGGMYEIIKVRKNKSKKDFPLVLKLFSYFFVILNVIVGYFITGDAFIFNLDYRIIALTLIGFITPLVFINNKKYNYEDAIFLIGSTLFLGLSFSLISVVRNISINYIIYLFLISTMTDTFALFVGKAIGKRKLAPAVSPNKTLEGSIGGMIIGSAIATTFYGLVIRGGMNIILVLFLTMVLSFLGVIGDLVFSAIKRFYDVKDYSNLIPGHGGILDRLDSIIFIVLSFVLFLELL